MHKAQQAPQRTEPLPYSLQPAQGEIWSSPQAEGSGTSPRAHVSMLHRWLLVRQSDSVGRALQLITRFLTRSELTNSSTCRWSHWCCDWQKRWALSSEGALQHPPSGLCVKSDTGHSDEGAALVLGTSCNAAKQASCLEHSSASSWHQARAESGPTPHAR